MDIGHSRLLKFFVKGDKMTEKHHLKIEVLVPTNIESEVPRQQNLRGAEDVPEDPPMDSNGADIDNGEIKWSALKGLLQPMYVGEPERPPARFRRPDPEEAEVPEDKSSSDEKKTKTRIPVSRFKTAVAKVQRERKDSKGSNEPKKKEAPEKPPRRSSIPKLSDRILAARKKADKTHNNEQIDKNSAKSNANHQPTVKPVEKKPVKMDRISVRRHFNRETENKDRNIATVKTELDETLPVTEFNEAIAIKNTLDQLDHAFDQLYDEIVDTEAESLPVEILSTKVKDPEKLESKFEEIVHQYDEETIEEVRVEPVDKARYSKIPLLKRRSEHEIKVPKQSERRLSLKTGLNKLAKTNAEQQASDEKMKPSTPSDDDRDLNQEYEVEAEKSVVLEDNAEIEVEKTDDDNLMEPQSPMPIPAYNVIATPDAELVKVGLSNFDIALERNAVTENNNTGNDIATPEPETVKVSVLDISNEANTVPVQTVSETIDIRVGYLVEEPISIDAPQNIENVIIIDKPEAIEVSEVSLIANDDIVNDKINEEDKKEESESNDVVKVATIDFNKPVEYHPIILDTVSEFKSVNLLRGTSGIEERTKSRYVNKPMKNESENTSKSFEEEIPIVKGKVSKILKRLTSKDDSDLISNNNVELKNDDVPLKGNVSEIINRMTSQDIDRNVKKEFDEIPKKKSVLSRIAMFERPAQEASLPKKQPYKYSKPKRTISEEIRHSPKIVQEVLKPNMRNGNTEKPYELVSIDIMQPTEVIVNNEEQALVVEELKEETVVFENLDHFELHKPINEPKEAIILDDNITTEEYFNNNERVEFKTEELIYTEDTFEPQNGANEETNFEIIGDRPNVIDSYRSRVVKEYIPVKEKIKRLKSHDDDSNLRRAKSTAELDIGEAVKGKVKNMIVRMNSMDFLDDRDDILGEKEKISAKERPRRSVSEKIAMFERKLTPVKMEDMSVNAGRALNIDPKPRDPTNTANSVHSPTKPHQPTEPAPTTEPTTLDQDYNDKIRELMSAKLTHGSVTSIPTVQLRDGKKMPVIALGTALLDPRLSKHIVASAIDLGFRAIDTAFIYGTEKEVGEGIRAKIQDGTVQREDLFIMSKLWSTFHKPELVETACRASLAALGLEYFDLFMIHNPMSFKEGNDPLPKIANVLQFSSYDYLDAWFAMEDLVGKGLVRSIGVSNFNSEQVARIVEKGRMKPVVDQVECHPYLSQQRLSDFCEARDVRLSCFGTLGSKGTPAELKASQAAAIDDPLVQVMAAGLGISAAQLLIRYQIECGHNVVVKASSAAHQWDVLRALSVRLAPAQLAALHALNRNKRAFTFKGMGDTHRNYPFKIPF